MIFNPIVVGGGVKLPELTNPGSAADLLASKQLIDADGNVLTGTMPTATQATPSISVSSAGLITASAAQTAGYVSAGTKSATKQLTTKAAATITPGTANQTIAAGRYLTGTQTIKGDANLLAENIKSGVSIFGVAGTAAPEVNRLETSFPYYSLAVLSGNSISLTLPEGALNSIDELVSLAIIYDAMSATSESLVSRMFIGGVSLHNKQFMCLGYKYGSALETDISYDAATSTLVLSSPYIGSDITSVRNSYYAIQIVTM